MKMGLRLLIIATIISSVINKVNAQYLPPDVFIKGNFIEIGINNAGAFGSGAVAPAGYHPRALTAFPVNRLGFVADPLMDGWASGTPNYIGDYFVPGTPHEGWDIMINGNWNRAWTVGGGGAFSSVPGPTLLTGANVSMTTIGDEKHGVWQGTFGNLAITQTTILDTNSLYFLVRVKLKNNGTTDLNDIYYNRCVDPDNEEELTGNFTTTNSIIFQPDAISNKCLVTGIGLSYPSVSYLGLGTVDCRAKSYVVTTGLSPTTNIQNIYNGLSSYPMNVGYTNTSDIGIGLVFNVGTIAAGDSTTLAYAYILNEDYLDSAFQVLSASLIVDSTTPIASSDTFYRCVGDTVNVAIEGGSEFNWNTWYPTTGLASSSGTMNTITVQDTPITYTVVGTTPVCDITDTLYFTVIPLIPEGAGEDGTIQMCGNAAPVNLYTALTGSPTPGGVWTGPGVSPSGMFSPVGFAEGSYVFTYTQSAGACVHSAQVTVNIINDVDIDFDFVINKGCTQDTVFFNNLGDPDSLVYYRWNFGDGSPHDSINFNTSHIYSPQDEYPVWLVGENTRGCIDSVMRFVDTKHPLDAVFTQSNDSICQAGANTIAFNDNSVGNVVSWYWDFGDGSTSALQNPTHSYTSAGTYEVRFVVTDDVPCTDTTYSTVFVDSFPYINVTVDRDSICLGEQIAVNIDYLHTATNIHWNFNDGLAFDSNEKSYTHNYATPGTYLVQVTTEHPVCPDANGQDTVLVKPYPNINLGGDTTICLEGSPYMIDAAALVSNPPNTVYYWSSGDTSSSLIVYHPGVYTGYADLNGCISSDAITIQKDCYLDIPNSFTPNNDGNNDYFLPRQLLGSGVVDCKMVIYNRWGEVVYETSNADGRGWDGKFGGRDQPEGVYVYQISVRYKNQSSEKYTGNVTLLR